MIKTTDKQRSKLRNDLGPPIKYTHEQIWTYLIADILDLTENQADFLRLFCGEEVPCTQRYNIWFETQPLSPRLGKPGVDNETNTIIDLAFGAIKARGTTGCGIEFNPKCTDSWVCFVEAKYLGDCGFMTTYDPLRNQLERDIESLLRFQENGQFPQRIYFTMLTPRRLKDNPRTRLYGYRMTEYLQDRDRITTDILRCPIPARTNYGQIDVKIAERVQVLKINWITYEDVLERAYGQMGIDVFDPTPIAELQPRLEDIATRLLASGRT